MTYPPKDRLHRHFRFLRVPQYSNSVGSDSIGTPVMFTGSVDMATTKTAGSPVYSLWLGYISELFLSYNVQQASNIKISTRIISAARALIPPPIRGASRAEEVKKVVHSM
jgi:hypothetical protein